MAANDQVIQDIDPEDNPLSIQSENNLPDLTAQWRASGDWGHAQLAGILRSVGYETENTHRDCFVDDLQQQSEEFVLFRDSRSVHADTSNPVGVDQGVESRHGHRQDQKAHEAQWIARFVRFLHIRHSSNSLLKMKASPSLR